MSIGGTVAITGWSVFLPGADISGLPHAPGPAEAKSVVGRKGLLYKETATRLALCAVHRALGNQDGVWEPPQAMDPATAVVASSNLGNAETVVETVRASRAGGWREVSPLSAPNASSNVIATTVAIWYRFGGPNLMLCSGAPSGLDAVAVGVRLITAGRAERVVVVGAEPDDPVAVDLHGRRGVDVGPLRAGAGCVVLQPLNAPGAVATVGGLRSVPDHDGTREPALGGDLYGAEGVVRVAMAAARMSDVDDQRLIEVVCGDAVDGWRAVTVRRTGVR